MSMTMTSTSAPPGAARSAPHCPRCRGRLAAERDRHGVYLSCFTCGFTQDALLGSAVTEPDDDAAAEAQDGATARAGIAAAAHRASPCEREPAGRAATDAAAVRPYVAPPARRCGRCQMRAWVWYARDPLCGRWRCSYCGGD